MKIIKETDIKSANYGDLKIQELLKEKEHLVFSKLIINENTKNRSEKTDNYFYILSGKGKTFIDDKIIKVCHGNLLFVPKNVSFRFNGEMTILKISKSC